MKVRRHFTIALALFLLLIFAYAPHAMAAEYVILGRDGEISMPISGLAPGARSTNCWEFAQTVYKAIWGVRFSGERGTADDLLRSVPTGSARAITTENTRNFISAARLGATIRITTYVDGDDTNGRYKHSMILIGKDENGFTVYEGSVRGRVRIKSYTWSEFANGYFGAHYGYYKYIKWPGANAYGEEPTEEEHPVTCLSALHGTAVVPGDINNDGVITSADARLSLRNAVMLETIETDSAAFLAGDVDRDGAITSADTRLILRAAVQLEDFAAE